MFKLPILDYKNSALSPIMSEQTLDLHHGKHHQTYITNLNNFIKSYEYEKLSLEDIIKKSLNEKKAGIFNNASQHWNHNLFWKCMKPNGGGNVPPKLENKIKNENTEADKFENKYSIDYKIVHSSKCLIDYKDCIRSIGLKLDIQ